jgi:hypothetical protein
MLSTHLFRSHQQMANRYLYRLALPIEHLVATTATIAYQPMRDYKRTPLPVAKIFLKTGILIMKTQMGPTSIV